jgi:hypothetical protein
MRISADALKRLAKAAVPIVLLAAAFYAMATRTPSGRCEWVAADPHDPPSFVPGYEKVKLKSPSRDCAKCHESPTGPVR